MHYETLKTAEEISTKFVRPKNFLLSDANLKPFKRNVFRFHKLYQGLPFLKYTNMSRGNVGKVSTSFEYFESGFTYMAD